MSQATVRAGLAAFFQTPQIEGMSKVYRDSPWFLDGGAWGLEEGELFGSVAFVHIDSSDETRITLPAQTGSKSVDYVVSLVIHYQYLIPSEMLIGADESDWVEGLDLILDAVKARIRSDQNAGTTPGAGLIFQQGENGADIRVYQDLPTLDQGSVYSFNRVEFNLTEIITA